MPFPLHTYCPFFFSPSFFFSFFRRSSSLCFFFFFFFFFIYFLFLSFFKSSFATRPICLFAWPIFCEIDPGRSILAVERKNWKQNFCRNYLWVVYLWFPICVVEIFVGCNWFFWGLWLWVCGVLCVVEKKKNL